MNAKKQVAVAILLVCAFCLPATARAELAFAPGSVTATAENADGTIDQQAGSHPYAYTVAFAFKTNPEGHSEGGVARDVAVDAPAGLVGYPLAVPRCTRQGFEGTFPDCPVGTQVGVVHATVPPLGSNAFFPLYNVVPPPGVAAEFGGGVSGYSATILLSARTEEGYRVRVLTSDIPLETTSVIATIWGVPTDPSHNGERGPEGGLEPTENSLVPFLALPTSCQAPLQADVSVDSTEDPGSFFPRATAYSLDAAGNPAPLIGCSSVPFSPGISAKLTTMRASDSSGLGFELHLPGQGHSAANAIVETEPEELEVDLPPEVTANASAAAGLTACSEEQFKAATISNAGCPNSSKLGTLLAHSPLIDEPVEGSVYLATPHHNPFDNLLSLYIVASAPERGVLIKQKGRVDIDQTTGQLTTTVLGLPPLPYSSFELDLRQGPRAPLTTPVTCGTLNATARLYPFSDPGTATVRTAPLTISAGPEGSSCVRSESQLPNNPSLEAGTQAPLAGIYSPFVLKLSRSAATQRFRSLNLTLPPGLTGRIAGVAECSDAQIALAQSRSAEGEGAVEQASPSCPSNAEIGIVTVGAGSGSPLYVQGHVYLAGPYKGAPLSMVIVTPAMAGPFDLGTVVVRAALYVDEGTARITVKSDSIPTSLHGIPLDVRSIAVQVTRGEFTRNPTNCEASAIGGEAISTSGQVATLQNRFQVGGCKGLDFKPHLKLFFTGQVKRLGNPAIKAVLTQPKGENANVASAAVILPKGMLIDNAHLNNPCTRVEFNSTPVPGAGCPAKSVLGTAKVWTPLLASPEEGNVYFRSNGGERQLPDLVVALRGKVPLQLVGFVDSVGGKHAELRRVRSRFLNLPDAPVSRFELKLAGGKRGLLENSKDLCKASDKAKFQLGGQNGKTHDTEPKVQVSCGKHSKKGKAKNGK